MPSPFVLVVFAFLMLVASIHGYRTLTALLVIRALPSTDTDKSSIVNGEPAAITGELVAEEPVETGDAAVENVDHPVCAYVWRTRLPDNTNSKLTISDWGWERQNWHTFASGIEWGRFCVDVDGQKVRIDPTWLDKTTNSDTLEDLELGGITSTQRFSVNLWNSWYTYLRNCIEHRSLSRFAGLVQRHNDSVNLDRYLLEARPLFEGTTVNISGEIHVDQGEPILQGTDENPLLLSDQGFNGHRSWLWQQVLRKGILVSGLLVVAISLWFGWYVPLAVLVVGMVLYIGYSFVKDQDIVLEWIRK